MVLAVPVRVLRRLRTAMSEKSEKGLLSKQREACRFNKCLLLLQCGKVRLNVELLSLCMCVC